MDHRNGRVGGTPTFLPITPWMRWLTYTLCCCGYNIQSKDVRARNGGLRTVELPASRGVAISGIRRAPLGMLVSLALLDGRATDLRPATTFRGCLRGRRFHGAAARAPGANGGSFARHAGVPLSCLFLVVTKREHEGEPGGCRPPDRTFKTQHALRAFCA